jgi:2-polyprenyl-3-methyl-5-hydroxy-6-metoxy-1,4-benzoquinol methylase
MTGPRTGDAFGDMVRAALRRAAVQREATVTEIIERDDGFVWANAAAKYLAAPPAWAPFERRPLTLARGRVLDVGCGAGRFSLPLQARGLPVTALDVSPGAAEVTMARGVRRVVTGTVADHAAGGVRYDTFLLMGENLGLLESATRAPAFLAELAAIAAPGAQIIGHGVDPLRAGHPAHARYFARNSEIGKLPGQMTLRIRHGDIEPFRVSGCDVL